MGKNILVISSSFRKGSNSDMLADEFIKGAEEKGHTAQKINLSEKTIGFCRGCLACQKTEKCVIKDDAVEIVEKMKNADIIAFATPIYYYEMSGQMKTMLDRANPLYPSDYSFRDIYMLMTAADDDENAVDNAVNGLKGWISCFPKARLAGYVFGGGVDGIREVMGHPAMKKAYEMGLAIE